MHRRNKNGYLSVKNADVITFLALMHFFHVCFPFLVH